MALLAVASSLLLMPPSYADDGADVFVNTVSVAQIDFSG
jgi:hypothetical protein